MMRKIIYATFIVLFTVLSSCVTKDVSIVKRKYSAGYYVNVSQHKNNILASKANHKLKETIKENRTFVQDSNNGIEVPKQAMTASVFEEANEKNNQKIYTASTNKLVEKLVSVPNKPAKSTSIYPNKIEHKSTKNLVDKEKLSDSKVKALLRKGYKSQTDLIVLVILSIFPILALIAMYLKDGERITLNFWVDLILHLTVVGYLIFALLVVFDIINLA